MTIRRRAIIAIASSVFIIALAMAFIRPGQSDTIRAGSGTVVSFTDNGVQAWGIDMYFSWRLPFAPRHLRLTEFPGEYRHEGTRVSVSYLIDDIIGIGKWDTVARLHSIRLLQ